MFLCCHSELATTRTTAQRLKATLARRTERRDHDCNRCVAVYRASPNSADATCCLQRLVLIAFTVGLARLCEYIFSMTIPNCIFIPPNFDYRLVTADPCSNILEIVFCLVTEQQLPSTICQRAQVSELSWHYWLRKIVATTAAQL